MTFKEIYTEELTFRVKQHPDQYCYGVERVPEIVDKMIAAMAVRTANIHDSAAIRATCRRLGIRCGIGPISLIVASELHAEANPPIPGSW